MFRVIIAGGRNFDNYEFLCEKCNKVLADKEDIQIISGTANGADKLGEKYAKEFNHPIIQYPADWNRFGLRAGYVRNEQMAQNADALIAFWDATSKGTKHMIDLARKYKLKVRVYGYK